MEPSPECYVDTSALIGFLDRDDRYHASYRRLFSDAPPLVTSALVIAEGHGWFLRKIPHRAAEFLTFVRLLKPLKIVPFGGDQIEALLPLLAKFEDQRLTMADAHGLLTMRTRRIKTCWSTDRHLGLTGVRLMM